MLKSTFDVTLRRLLSLTLVFSIALAIGSSLAFGATDVAYLPDGFDPQAQSVLKLPVITLNSAKILFANILTHHEIPWRLSSDGCYAKAMALVRLAEIQGIVMDKVFAEGNLSIRSPLSSEQIAWSWHVAAVAAVKDGAVVIIMVFDPALFTEPVTVEQWKAALLYSDSPPRGDGPDIDQPSLMSFYFGSRFQYLSKSAESRKTSYFSKDLAQMNLTLKQLSSVDRIK